MLSTSHHGWCRKSIAERVLFTGRKSFFMKTVYLTFKVSIESVLDVQLALEDLEKHCYYDIAGTLDTQVRTATLEQVSLSAPHREEGQ